LFRELTNAYCRNYRFFHDTSAALLSGGDLVAFVEEERLSRVKHAPGIFPEKAIEFCLREGGISFEDLDAIVCEHDIDAILTHDISMEPYKTIMARDSDTYAWHRKIFLDAKNRFIDYAKQNNIKNIIFAPHHHTHLAAAYYGSGFSDALVLSIDGRGDTQSAIIAVGSGGDINVLDEIELPNSLGLLYASVTKYLGYTPFDGEGTVMGLAAYGTDRFKDVFDEMVGRIGHRFTVKADAAFNDLIDPLCKGIQCPLVNHFGEPRKFDPDPRNGVDEDIAASLQACVERAVRDYVHYYIEKTGIRKLCVAGGVAYNSKMNGQLFQMLQLDDIYAFPVAGDAGCAIGAAMWYSKQVANEAITSISSAYYGPHYSAEEIRRALKKYSLTASKPGNIANSVATLLADHNIVGWFQGRMEAGPRALGARSILSNPSSIADKDAVNIKVKYREAWRPFAPSILYENREKYMGSKISAPFMSVTFKAPEAVQSEIIGAMHVDGTIRPQTVQHDVNPLYYDLINNFKARTGIGAISNTSFNRKGEPIINTPDQAIEMFLATELDALAIGPYLALKQRSKV